MTTTMPEEFWLIGCHGLVWDRTALAFVPARTLARLNQREVMERFRFLTESGAEAQVNELAALGVVARAQQYKVKEKS